MPGRAISASWQADTALPSTQPILGIHDRYADGRVRVLTGHFGARPERQILTQHCHKGRPALRMKGALSRRLTGGCR